MNSFSFSTACVSALLLATVAGCSASSAADVEDTAPSAEQALTSSDPCVVAARDAAEKEYGDAPDGTTVKALTKGAKYRVTVGINNPESGPQDYYVEFPKGCSGTPKVSDVPELPHPLRDAMQHVYNGILANHGNALPDGFAVAASAMPASARKQFKTWTDNGPNVCTGVHSYEIKVSGQETFAVSCDVAHDSIKTSIAIYDGTGGDIDQVAIYGTKDVGQDGRSWQNETFLQQD